MGQPVQNGNKEPYFLQKVRLLLCLLYGADDIQRRNNEDQVVIPVFPEYKKKDQKQQDVIELE